MIWFITEFRLLQSLVILCLKKLSSKLIKNVVGFFGKEIKKKNKKKKKIKKKMNKLTSYSIATNSVLFVLASTLHRGKCLSLTFERNYKKACIAKRKALHWELNLLSYFIYGD